MKGVRISISVFEWKDRRSKIYFVEGELLKLVPKMTIVYKEKSKICRYATKKW